MKTEPAKPLNMKILWFFGSWISSRKIKQINITVEPLGIMTVDFDYVLRVCRASFGCNIKAESRGRQSL